MRLLLVLSVDLTALGSNRSTLMPVLPRVTARRWRNLTASNQQSASPLISGFCPRIISVCHTFAQSAEPHAIGHVHASAGTPKFRLEDGFDGCGLHCDGFTLNDWSASLLFAPNAFASFSLTTLWRPLISASSIRPIWFLFWFALKSPLRTGPK